MAAYRGGGGFPSRDALHARSSGASSSYVNDQSQVSINMPDAFDLDNEVEGLRGQIGRLKQVAHAIGEENVLQAQAANSLEEVLDQAGVAMKKGIRRVNRALQQSKSNHFLYLALFCLAIFFALYLWARLYRFVKKVH